MSKPKAKKTVLFSQCGIRIEKLTDASVNGYGINCNDTKITENGDRELDKRYVCDCGRYNIKCKSPLGFYYEKPKQRAYNPYKEVGSRRTYTVYFPKEKYEISYIKSLHDTWIGFETRPWDLGDGTMNDNSIKVLEDTVKKIFSRIDDSQGNFKDSISNFKISLMEDLFGSKDGVKTQTNDGKILSHGFDLKTSFRKRKET